MADIFSYERKFSNLNVRIVGGAKSPNKAIMLISIMELIRCGYISRNRIYLDETIKWAFDSNWRLYIGTEPPIAWTPFWHMKNESFWHFKPIDSIDIESLAQPGETATIGKMRTAIEYVYLEDDLFEIMKDAYNRCILYEALKREYLPA